MAADRSGEDGAALPVPMPLRAGHHALMQKYLGPPGSCGRPAGEAALRPGAVMLRGVHAGCTSWAGVYLGAGVQ